MCGVVICTKPWLWWMLWLGSEWTGSLIVFCMRDHHLELKTAASLLPLVCVYVQRNYCRKGPNLLTLPARDSWWLSYPHRKSSGCWHLVRDPWMLQFLARTWCSRRRRSSSPGACTACSWQRKHTWCYVIQGCCLSPCHHVQGRVSINRAKIQVIPGITWVLAPEIMGQALGFQALSPMGRVCLQEK